MHLLDPSDASGRAPDPCRHSPRLSRRGVLGAGLLGLGALVVSGCSGSTDEHVVRRTVTPVWSEQAYRAFGVCAHPTFQTSGYRHTEDWVAALAAMNAYYFRGLYVDHLPLVDDAVQSARQHGVRWGMLVCNDLGTPPEVVVRRVESIARDAADVCLFVEGVNEPNYSRSGGTVPADWPERTVAVQRALYDAVRATPALDHVTVVGPSLQAFVATAEDYQRLADLGLGEVMDAAGLHSYPSGHYPAQALDQRLAPIRDSFPDVGVWLTETGYTNAVDTGEGNSPVPEEVAAAYAPAAVLEAVDRGLSLAWYEALDDPDPGGKNVSESNFGLLATEGVAAGPPWRAKPAVAALRDFLAGLRDPGGDPGGDPGADPGADYAPPPVQLEITSTADDVAWTALGRRDGSTGLYLRRRADRWDPETGTAISVPAVKVEVRSGSRTQTVQVDSTVRELVL